MRQGHHTQAIGFLLDDTPEARRSGQNRQAQQDPGPGEEGIQHQAVVAGKGDMGPGAGLSEFAPVGLLQERMNESEVEDQRDRCSTGDAVVPQPLNGGNVLKHHRQQKENRRSGTGKRNGQSDQPLPIPAGQYIGQMTTGPEQALHVVSQHSRPSVLAQDAERDDRQVGCQAF